ncbi:MAG: exodeoxyribonuclease VII large subunit [Geodermatophilaceae bacterium]|nr:exodeoxyribonuclease VII large subunit [Geodermatophilaceae bacterium]
MPAANSADTPWPVRTVARKIGEWVARLGEVWVEGQVTQLSTRSGTCFLVLRDTSADISVSVTCRRDVLPDPLGEGARVVLRARPDFYLGRGSLSLRATEIRPVGIGELLARLEKLKKLLTAEGLFDIGRKRQLPFLPRAVGLVTGRASAAERDVLTVARQRWPGVAFRVENCAVQGPNAAAEVIGAIRRLDADPDIEVVVVARGGGSVEDLLPFSDEALCRAVAACRTAVVSAIGHEPDSPLLDHVADVRAATPTDAAKRVVPDVVEEARRVGQLRDRLRRTTRARITAEQQWLDAARSRPVLADPGQLLRSRVADCDVVRDRLRRQIRQRVGAALTDLSHARARVTALSPAATLNRGYAVVQQQDGRVLLDEDDAASGDRLRVRLAIGRLDVTVE